jgi:hypothetical protein
MCADRAPLRSFVARRDQRVLAIGATSACGILEDLEEETSMSGSEANDFQVRGYMILNTLSYLSEKVGEPDAKRIIAGFPPEVRDVISSAKSGGLYPVAALSHSLGAVAALGNGDENRARDNLVMCGTFMAREATNTFFKLVMKMLTPALFIKKLPDFWKRDCTKGRLEVDIKDRTIVFRFFDMKGFDHAVCTGTGFVTFALQTMGKTIEKTSIQNWSLENPSADGALSQITYRD